MYIPMHRLAFPCGLLRWSLGTCLHEGDELLLQAGLQVWSRHSKLMRAGVRLFPASVELQPLAAFEGY